MVMHPVSSTDIASIGYENGTLYISFHKGGTYAYFGVPQSVYAGSCPQDPTENTSTHLSRVGMDIPGSNL